MTSVQTEPESTLFQIFPPYTVAESLVPSADMAIPAQFFVGEAVFSVQESSASVITMKMTNKNVNTAVDFMFVERTLFERMQILQLAITRAPPSLRLYAASWGRPWARRAQ